MSETPRLRSAFPATPRTNIRPRSSNNGPAGFQSPPSSQPKSSPITRPVKTITPLRKQSDGPLVPLETIDAPTQRFYVAAFYIGLLAWRLYNSWNVTDDLDSTWLFLKWIGLDAAFFVALPAFRIPWLQLSFATTVTMWLLHAILNAFLMYKIPIPILSWLGALVKVAYDRELAISDHRVKPGDILHNSSVILGKQIIQILPEGSAILNPQKYAFCLDAFRTAVELPIQINQTTPISIELKRYDIDTDEVENIVISGKTAKNLKKEADRSHAKGDTNTPRTLHYSVSKKGLYRLTRVLDESNLEVRKRSYDVAVVACPKAFVSVDKSDKCTGDLSGVSLQVEGVPPFKVVYSKRINQQQFSSITQSVQPPDHDQYIAADGTSNVVLDPNSPQRGWTQSRTVSVDINESLNQNGTWSYHVEEVEDGLGNKAMFDTGKSKTKASVEAHSKAMTVHRRPIVYLSGCNSQKPLILAEGDTANLPLRVKDPDHIYPQDWPLDLGYTFKPENDGDVTTVEDHNHELVRGRSGPTVQKAGQYSLVSVRSQYCQGEVREPSSCSLINPPRPDIAMQHEDIFDKCAGNPIGMLVNLDFTGTPPFEVRYTVTHQGKVHRNAARFETMRGQLDFQEHVAGSYTYQIWSIKDSVYDAVPLDSRDLVIKQDIKPAASASYINSDRPINACLGRSEILSVRLQGESPWDLDYELVHNGKRKKHSLHSELDTIDINIPELKDGGHYSVVLTSVQDKSKCRKALTQEREIEVRPQRPSAAFGDIDGRYSVKTLEGKTVDIPLRLQGIKPWTVHIQNIDRGTEPKEHVLHDLNAAIRVQEAGTYEIISVHDSCPGVVDPKANRFSIDWIERPSLSLKDNTADSAGTNLYRKAPVCRGDEDSLNLALTGNAPYHVSYSQKSEPMNEKPGISTKRFSAASSKAVIKMETSKAGEYTYTFNELSDHRYDHSKYHFSPVTVKQQVYALPTAKFDSSGKVYSYCKDDPSLSSETNSDKIPIAFTGTAPFSIEIAIIHHGISVRPEIKKVHDIPSNSYSWSLAGSTFELGTHSLQIRSVKDAHGCESVFDTSPSTVKVQVSAPPSISALESSTDYCVGDHVSFSLSGQAPFEVFFTFQGKDRKAREPTNEFSRFLDLPGEFVITGVSDAAMGNKCKARKEIHKIFHPFPSVRIERGKTKIDDIHEGGEVDIHFEFTGTPPFEFTYTRSENQYTPNNSKNFKSKKQPNQRKPGQILETRHDVSTEFSKTIRASEEGTYEVVAIKDRYCAYSAVTGAGRGNGGGVGSSKLIKN